MHELGLALEICALVERTVGPARVPTVTALGLVVGDEANVEISSLTFCLEAVLAEPPFARPCVHLVRAPDDALRLDYVEMDDDGPGDRGP